MARSRKILAALLLISLCGLVILCFRLPQLLGQRIHEALEPYAGFTVGFDSIDLDLNRFALTDFELESERSIPQFTLTASSASLSYDYPEIFRGQAAALRLQKAKLFLRSGPLKSVSVSDNKEESFDLIASLKKPLPLEEVDIDSFEIENNYFVSIPAKVAGSLQLFSGEETIHVHSRLSNLHPGLPPITLDSDVSLQSLPLLKADFAVEVKDLDMRVEGNASQNLESGSGEVSFRSTEIPLLKLFNLLEQFDVHSPEKLSIISGTLLASGRYSWDAEQHSLDTASIQLQQGLLRYQDSEIGPLNAKIPISSLGPLSMNQWGELKMGRIEYGVVAENVYLQFLTKHAGSNSYLTHIRNFSASVFGGSLTAETLSVNSETLKSSTTLEFQNIDLEKILDLYPGSAVKGTGILQGSLPFQFSEHGATVNKGTARTTSAGRIWLSERTYSSLKPSLGIAAEALRDFRYESLEAQISLDEDGELFLTLQLKGESPFVQRGRQINFNIQVQENIPELLKSITIGSEISSAIQNKGTALLK